MISMDKQYRTRDGREVKLLMLDGGGSFPVIGAVQNPPSGTWEASQWTVNGNYLNCDPSGPFDLVEVRPRFRYDRWVNVYPGAMSDFWGPVPWNTKEQADASADSRRIACVKIIIEGTEGDGL